MVFPWLSSGFSVAFLCFFSMLFRWFLDDCSMYFVGLCFVVFRCGVAIVLLWLYRSLLCFFFYGYPIVLIWFFCGYFRVLDGFTMDFLCCTYGIRKVFPRFSCGFPTLFALVARCVSYGLHPEVFLWVSFGFPHAVLRFVWYSFGFPMRFLWIPKAFPMVSIWFPYGFPMHFLWISHAFLVVPRWVSSSFSILFLWFSIPFVWVSHALPLLSWGFPIGFQAERLFFYPVTIERSVLLPNHAALYKKIRNADSAKVLSWTLSCAPYRTVKFTSICV